MRSQIALALFLSIVLIGGASWQRFNQSSEAMPTLVAAQEFVGQDDAKEAIKEFLEPKSENSLATASNEPLSNTDLIGRELIMDYIGLAANGQVTDQTLQALADKHLVSIPYLNKPETINSLDLKVVTNTKANFQNYANSLANIYQRQAGKTSGLQTGTNTEESISPVFYSSAVSIGNAYKESALALKNLPVPASLTPLHLQLVNIHFSNATAMIAVSEMESDPAAAFSGLVTTNQNLNKESLILKEIQNILNLNGV